MSYLPNFVDMVFFQIRGNLLASQNAWNRFALQKMKDKKNHSTFKFWESKNISLQKVSKLLQINYLGAETAEFEESALTHVLFSVWNHVLC